MNDMDPHVKALVTAIGKQESNNNYTARGASGEFGAYQFMPDTYKAWAKEFLGDENAPPSMENQNKIAYSRVKSWKDQGLTPAQIAAAWNAGEGKLKNDAWKKNVGTNDFGVKYDTPSYVKNVSKYFDEKVAQIKPEVNTDGTPKSKYDFLNQPIPEAQVGPVDKSQRAADIGKGVLDMVADPFRQVGSATANVFRDQNQDTKSYENFSGDQVNVPGYKNGEEVGAGKTAVQLAGAGLGIASTVVPFLKGGKVLEAFNASPIKSGLGYGYAQDVSNNIKSGDDGLGAAVPGMNTAIGGGIGIFAKGAQTVLKPVAQAREEAFMGGIDDLRNRTKATDNAFDKNTITRKTDAGEETITPVDTWFKNEAPIPTVNTSGGTATVDSKSAVDHFNGLIKKSDDGLIQSLQDEGVTFAKADVKRIADEIVKNTDNVTGIANGKVTREEVTEALSKRIENLSKEHGDVWDGPAVRDVLKGANGDFKDEVTKDVSRLLGDTMRELMYNYTSKGRAELNKMQELISARKFAEVIDGKKVAGGGLGNMFARGIGAAAGGMLSGPLGVILGSEVGSKVGKAIQHTSFMSPTAEAKAAVMKLLKMSGNKEELKAVESMPTGAPKTMPKAPVEEYSEPYVPDNKLPTIKGFADTGMLAKLGVGSAGALGVGAAANKLQDKYGTETYTREPDAVTPAPAVVEEYKDNHGPVLKLDSGVTVRPAGPYTDAIAQAYKAYPNLPKGFLESVLMKESSMGTQGQDNNNPGEYGWLVALTKPTVKDIKAKSLVDPRYRELASKLNFDTPQDAIMSAAAYASFRQRQYSDAQNYTLINDPVALYVDRYNAAPTARDESAGKMSDTFKKYLDYYQNA